MAGCDSGMSCKSWAFTARTAQDSAATASAIHRGDLTPEFYALNRTIHVVHTITVRPALPRDAAAVAGIYAPYVEQTTISFEDTAPGVDDIASRIEKSRSRWQWLVAELDDAIVGYAYGSEHRTRAAYRWSVEVSAYVHRDHHRKGIGRTLYDALFVDLADKGFCNAFAGITLPNEPSVRLHSAMGFEPIGTFRSVGWKFGRWHDVAWFQRPLREGPPTIVPS
jgi:phosphinothricin acetyltransferase